jgi:GTP-binding protein
MLIHSANFVKSSTTAAQCPEGDLPEYAFIGRSNVGKSSLINMLTGKTKLSKVSSTPGKTRLINHFLINNQWYLVDLPGYGYAKTTKTSRRLLAQIIADYLKQRETLTLLFVLIDSRLEPQQIDQEFINYLGEQSIPFHLILTKTDKVSATAVQRTLKQWESVLLQTWEELPLILLSSAEKGAGKEDILNTIAQINHTL